MKYLLIILPLFFKAQIPDDAKHFYAGFGISMGVGYVTYEATDRWLVSMGTGLGAGILAGVAKEYVWDKAMKRGTFSKNDMVVTSWGALVGSICLVVPMDTKEKKQSKRLKKYYELQ